MDDHNMNEEQEMLEIINDDFHGQTKVEWYEEHRLNPEIDPDHPEKVVKERFLPKYPNIKDLNSATREITDQKGNFTIVEYTMKFDFIGSDHPDQEYYKAMSGKRRKQLIINLEDYFYAKIIPGSLTFTAGDVDNKMDFKGPIDHFYKKSLEKFIDDRIIYETFYGHGQLVLENTERFIILIDAEKYGESGLIIEPDVLLAFDNDIEVEHQLKGEIISRLLGRQKKIVSRLTGQGVIAFLSNVPKGQLVEIELHDEKVRIDGYAAVCYSASLKYSTEFAQKGHWYKSLMTTDKTLLNVFEGTGRVLLSPIAPSSYDNKTHNKIKSLDEAK